MVEIFIIGGSDAGVSAALRIKEVAPSFQVHMLLKDEYPNYSICGIPFYLSKEVTQPDQLAHRSLKELKSAGIDVLLHHEVEQIHPEDKKLTVSTPLGKEVFAYDKLLMATGAKSVTPAIEGLDLVGVFQLRWIDDMLIIASYLQEHQVKEVVIIGAGYIGVEMAEAFTLRELTVHMIEASDYPLQTFDPELGLVVRDYLMSKKIHLYQNHLVKKISQRNGSLSVETNKTEVRGQVVLVVTGAQPASELAHQAGIHTGARGAIKVDGLMHTNLEDIYAAGDCCETYHRLLQQYDYLPLGTTAHKQGRVAGENIAGGKRYYGGSLGTQVVKVFDHVAARTGLREGEARKAGIPCFSAVYEAYDHKSYYPGASSILIKLTARSDNQQLLGVQMWGAQKAEVAKRIDVVATAIHQFSTVEQLNDLDLSYSPPLGTPWDALQMSAQHWLRIYNTSIHA
ncbi:FAD-dependent oxidoreductase [Catalinimonas sp. 4WD22]|jgi:NADPH-dependent 2,4-dienoyl-CoA reductase/sulfur reductase-like enzyme|uniref:FAD-dependent oxidoreductase n=1 Tax=Catalinimonas locisalis TaxID=3133978 RepID=UPI003100CD78